MGDRFYKEGMEKEVPTKESLKVWEWGLGGVVIVFIVGED